MPEFKSAAELYAVLDKMVANLQANPGLKSRIGQDGESLGFIITDLKADYALRFAKGEASGAQGSAAGCSVAISLTSGVLDKILSGKMDPESAYTYGSLTLRGSEYVAEGMLRYWRDIVSAYQAASA